MVAALPAAAAGGFVSPAPPTHVTPIAIANGAAATSPVSGIYYCTGAGARTHTRTHSHLVAVSAACSRKSKPLSITITVKVVQKFP